MLTPAQRFERLVVIILIFGLAFTGLVQKYATEDLSRFLIVIMGGIESTRIIHRVLALVLMAEMVYHTVMMSYRWFAMGLRPVLLPHLREVGSFFGQILYNLGLKSTPASPEMPLKIEYLVILVSLVLLAITGAILWNPIGTTSVMSGVTVPVAHSIHSSHALVFVMFIIIWRLAIIVLWRPQHPAESHETAASGRRFIIIPILGLITVLLALGIIAFATIEQTAIDTVPRHAAVVFAPQAMPDAGDVQVGEALWSTLRCSFCHGVNGDGGLNGEPALRHAETLTFDAFYHQVRVGSQKMPAFSAEELPDGYLMHLWAWLSQ